MFAIINKKQHLEANNQAKLKDNSIFIGTPGILDEEKLYSIIKNSYENKNKEKLLQYCNIYYLYKYKKYLDIIEQYNNKSI